MKKTTGIAVVVFLLLVVGAMITLKKPSERGMTRVSLAQLDTQSIDRLEIIGESPVVLEKRDGKWVLAPTGRAADPAAIKTALDALAQMVSSTLVTENPERFDEYQAGDTTGAHVLVAADGVSVADFWVGRATGGGSFVRIEGAVYEVKKVFRSTYVRDTAAWQQRKLYDDALDAVSRVEVSLKGQAPYTLIRKDSAYVFEDASVVPAGFRYDASAARSLAASLVNLRAKEFLDVDPGPEQTGLTDDAGGIRFFVAAAAPSEGAPAGGEPAAATASATPAVTQTRELRLGASQPDGSSYARRVETGDLLLLPKYAAQSINKSAADLRDMRLVDVEAAKVDAFKVNRGKTQLAFKKQGDAWQLVSATPRKPDDFQLEPRKVLRQVAAMAGVSALKLAPAGVTPRSAGLLKPSAVLTATLDDGSTKKLVFGKTVVIKGAGAGDGAGDRDGDGELVYVRGTIDDAIYLLAKWNYDNLTAGIEAFGVQDHDLMDNGLAGLGGKGLDGLSPEVRAAVEAQMRQKQLEEAARRRAAVRAARQPSAAPVQ